MVKTSSLDLFKGTVNRFRYVESLGDAVKMLEWQSKWRVASE